MVKEKEKKKKARLINGELLKKIMNDLTEVLDKYDLSDPEIVYVVTFLYQGMMDLDADKRKQSLMSAKLQSIQRKMMEKVKKRDL